MEPCRLALLRNAFGFCLSSRYEGVSLALIEAAALGVPCIATDCVAGPREVLADGRYGELVAVEDPTALGNAMARHLADPAPLLQRAQASFLDRDRLSMTSAHARFAQAIEELLRV